MKIDTQVTIVLDFYESKVLKEAILLLINCLNPDEKETRDWEFAHHLNNLL